MPQGGADVEMSAAAPSTNSQVGDPSVPGQAGGRALRPTQCALVLVCAALGLALHLEWRGTLRAEESEVEVVRRFVPPTHGYHALGATTALLDTWQRADPVRVQRLDLPASAGGIVPPAIVFGATPPGSARLEERSTVLLLGGLDGRSLAGSEAVLRATHGLLEALDELRPDLAFVAVPWASPDGLARASAGIVDGGGSGVAVDDDEDGLAGEDPSDDLDGDGQVLELLVEDARGPWTFSRDRRFLVPAAEGDAPRLLRRPEGRDDDGDGRWNEDGPGGVQLDAHFPSGWRGPLEDGRAGRFPLEDPLARALAELALTRRTALALVFQGAHGYVARPGGTLAAELASARDHASYQALATAFTRATGRVYRDVPSLRVVRGGEAPGAAIDWLHGTVGAISAEVAVWGPDAVDRDGRAMERSFGSTQGRLRGPQLGPLLGTRVGPLPSDEQRLWARWLDDVRGGLDFADWRLVELGVGRRTWVGGWRNRVDVDPPADSLAHALEGVAPFVREVVDGLPRLDIEVLRVERNGELVHLRARVVNRGVFPTGREDANLPASVSAARDGRVVLTFEPPCAEALVAGRLVHELGLLAGGAAGPDHEWLVVAPPGTTLALHARTAASGTVTRELRP